MECVLERQTLAQVASYPTMRSAALFHGTPTNNALLYLGARNDWAKESLFETLEHMGQDMSSSFWMVSQVLCHGNANLAHAQVTLWQNGLQTQSGCRWVTILWHDTAGDCWVLDILQNTVTGFSCSFIICPRQRFSYFSLPCAISVVLRTVFLSQPVRSWGRTRHHPPTLLAAFFTFALKSWKV